MWYLRILNGPQAGKAVALREGSQTLGRSPQAGIKIMSNGVSKEHLKVDVLGDRVVITDLNSRNGTVVNGVRIKTTGLKAHDKILLHDVLLEIIPARQQQQAGPQFHQQQMGGQQKHQVHAPQQMHVQEEAAAPSEFAGRAKTYIEDVLMPGIYMLPRWTEFKFVLAGFIGIFIVLVTALSSIPLMRILKSSVEQESQRRALTIARNLAAQNRSALMQGLETGISVGAAQREAGVQEALIVSQVDGNILAPANKAGKYPDASFVHAARKNTRETVEQINSGSIGAAVPIEFYNSETGTQSVTAYAIVIYDMGSLAVDDARTLSLFVQTFFIASLMGAVLFFLLYRLISHPYAHLNDEIDRVLKEGGDLESLDFQWPELQKLTATISSLVVRASSAVDQNNASAPIANYDRSHEMARMAQLIGFPAVIISWPDQLVRSANGAFEQLSGLIASDVVFQPVSQIKDQALKLNFQDLVGRVSQNPNEQASNRLDFSGIEHDILAQPVWGANELAYVVIIIVPSAQGLAA